MSELVNCPERHGWRARRAQTWALHWHPLGWPNTAPTIAPAVLDRMRHTDLLHLYDADTAAGERGPYACDGVSLDGATYWRAVKMGVGQN
jgi:hypothetical protein